MTPASIEKKFSMEKNFGELMCGPAGIATATKTTWRPPHFAEASHSRGRVLRPNLVLDSNKNVHHSFAPARQ
jgi:hypothetical protein